MRLSQVLLTAGIALLVAIGYDQFQQRRGG